MFPPLAHDPTGSVIPRQYAIDLAQSLRGYPPGQIASIPPGQITSGRTAGLP